MLTKEKLTISANTVAHQALEDMKKSNPALYKSTVDQLRARVGTAAATNKGTETHFQLKNIALSCLCCRVLFELCNFYSRRFQAQITGQWQSLGNFGR